MTRRWTLCTLLSLTLAFAAGSVRAESAAPTSADEIRPLLVGSEVPDITLQSLEGQAVSLATAVKKQSTVVIFYRGGW